ncbi:MAG: LysR substrate-binding domain-containing protein [Bacteroidota bacterium]|nr:LysR substrate-binding domain-containing protein [Bacteroidota bacterium]
MTLQQLEYVIALDKYRNFTKAAERSFVTQPTLTMQLKKLENEVGIRIFDRGKKPLSPTPAGQQFIQSTRQILAEVEVLKRIIHNETEEISGTFKLGIIPTLAPYLLPLFLPEFIRKFPGTKLHIEEMQSESIIKALIAEQIHIGILATPVEEKHLREIPIFNEAFLGYFPDGHFLLGRKSIHADELVADELLLLSEGHCFRNQAINICHMDDYERNKTFDYQSGSVETLKKLVNRRVGYTLVPELSVHEEISSNPRIRRFSVPEPSREVSLLVHRNFPREGLLEILGDTIKQNLPPNILKVSSYKRIKWR